MKANWLVNTNGKNDTLIVFVLGWAGDPVCVGHIRPTGCDVLCLYDHRELTEIPYIPLEKYTRRYLFAWSFGVWVSEQLFPDSAWTRAVAYCGSPFPVDPRYGIDPKRLIVTLHGMRKHGSDEFNRRTYGSHFASFEPLLPFRDHEANLHELVILHHASIKPYTPSVSWDRAVIGSEDLIFPVENLCAYWGDRAEILPLPHYPFGDAKLIEREIERQ